MNILLEGKTIFIAGSTRGIGLNIAKRLIEEGCQVILNGRDSERLKAAMKDINCKLGISGDLSTIAGVNKAQNYIKRNGLLLDSLICNAGSGHSVPPGDEFYNEWVRVFHQNLFVTTNTIEGLNQFLNTHNRSTILAISSICGQESLGAPLAYSAAKAALNSYLKGIAKVYGKKGIRVNGVAPGNIIFKGSTWDKKLNEEADNVKKMLKNEVALQRLGTPDEISSAVCFLISDHAAFISGEILVVDGGQVRS